MAASCVSAAVLMLSAHAVADKSKLFRSADVLEDQTFTSTSAVSPVEAVLLAQRARYTVEGGPLNELC